MHACMQVWVHVAMCMRTLHHPQRPFPLSARVLTQARGGRGRMTFGVGTWAVRVQWLFFCNILLFFGMWLFEPMCPPVGNIACMHGASDEVGIPLARVRVPRPEEDAAIVHHGHQRCPQ